MAHEITIRADGYAEMAFVGQTPWHGLGQELPVDANMDAWRKAAGMDWEIKQAPVQYLGETLTLGGHHTFDGQFVQYRSDTKAPLGIVSQRYKPVQPAEVLEFFSDLVEESGFRLHTAGTLFGGRRMWALAETGKFAEVSDGDGIGAFLLLSTSTDRSLSTTARFTSIRVVCNNTLSMAVKDGSHSVSFTHSRAFDHELMKRKLGAAVQSFDAFMMMAKHLRKQQMSSAAADKFVRTISLTAEQQIDPQYQANKNRMYAKVIELFEGSAKGSEMAGHTKWGMVNAVTEYLDHHHPARTQDAKLNSTWFGIGDSIKAKTLELLAA